jgi:hypothetical protein
MSGTQSSTDSRKLERTKHPGIYRRHANGCTRSGRCHCPYVVRFKDRDGASRKQIFPTLERAREFKGSIDSGAATRQQRSSETAGNYYPDWIANYRGRTKRELQESSRREFTTSFEHHILPLGIAKIRMRDLQAPDLKQWFKALEKRGASPNTIRKARAALATMLADALEDGAITVNPAAGVRYVPDEQALERHPKRRHKALTAADVLKVLAAMPGQWQAFFTLLAAVPARLALWGMKMVEDRGVAPDADLFGNGACEPVVSLARGVSPDLGIVLRSTLVRFVAVGALGRRFCHRSDRRDQCRR